MIWEDSDGKNVSIRGTMKGKKEKEGFATCFSESMTLYSKFTPVKRVRQKKGDGSLPEIASPFSVRVSRFTQKKRKGVIDESYGRQI